MTFAAILNASRMSGDSPGALRASLHFAGQTLIEYQARQAAQAGASRIVILVSVITPALSRSVDRLNADGIIVALIRDMVSLVRDAPRDYDALLVGDGAIVSQAHFDAMGQREGNGLLVADDSRASAPLERIDAGQRWAGLARVAPSLLFGTLDMIGDWDLELTLVRAAIQAGAWRVAVPQEDLMEGRVAIVDGQQQADLVAQSVMSTGAQSSHGQGGIERYIMAPLARKFGPSLMRTQVPAVQVRTASMGLAAVALVPIELLWSGTGLVLLLAALLIGVIADRLDELSLRAVPLDWAVFVTPGLALVGVALVGGTAGSVMLALLLAIILVADRWQRIGAARPWMIFTPGSAVLVLLLSDLVGRLDAGFLIAMLAAIASVGAIILRHRD